MCAEWHICVQCNTYVCGVTHMCAVWHICVPCDTYVCRGISNMFSGDSNMFSGDSIMLSGDSNMFSGHSIMFSADSNMFSLISSASGMCSNEWMLEGYSPQHWPISADTTHSNIDSFVHIPLMHMPLTATHTATHSATHTSLQHRLICAHTTHAYASHCNTHRNTLCNTHFTPTSTHLCTYHSCICLSLRWMGRSSLTDEESIFHILHANGRVIAPQVSTSQDRQVRDNDRPIHQNVGVRGINWPTTHKWVNVGTVLSDISVYTCPCIHTYANQSCAHTHMNESMSTLPVAHNCIRIYVHTCISQRRHCLSRLFVYARMCMYK